MKLELEKILNEISPYRDRRAFPDQKQTALLVIDMQNYFQKIAKPITLNVLNIIKFFRSKNIPVIFTQHGHKDPVKDGGILREWWGEIILEGTEDWRFLPEINVEPNDIVLPKKRYSAFFETDLDSILRKRDIRDLVISGVMTNLCCETTARDAFMRDYRVFFLIDGTATGKEEHHIATLKNLGFGFAYLITCEELLANLS